MKFFPFPKKTSNFNSKIWLLDPCLLYNSSSFSSHSIARLNIHEHRPLDLSPRLIMLDSTQLFFWEFVSFMSIWYICVCFILHFCWCICLHLYVCCPYRRIGPKRWPCVVRVQRNMSLLLMENFISVLLWSQFCRRVDGVLVGKTVEECRQRMEWQ